MRKLKTISEQVYDYVVEMITEDVYKDGDKVTEADLLQQLDTSRTPIRDALKQLVADGVLAYEPRKGYFVKGFSYETSALDYEIIARLDLFAAQLALNNLTDEDYMSMQNYIDILEDAIINFDFELYKKTQESFHKVYRSRCGNYRLDELISQMVAGAARASAFFTSADTTIKAMKHANEDHKKILEAFKSKDAEVLPDLIIAHWDISYV